MPQNKVNQIRIIGDLYVERREYEDEEYIALNNKIEQYLLKNNLKDRVLKIQEQNEKVANLNSELNYATAELNRQIDIFKRDFLMQKRKLEDKVISNIKSVKGRNHIRKPISSYAILENEGNLTILRNDSLNGIRLENYTGLDADEKMKEYGEKIKDEVKEEANRNIQKWSERECLRIE